MKLLSNPTSERIAFEMSLPEARVVGWALDAYCQQKKPHHTETEVLLLVLAEVVATVGRKQRSG